MSDYLKGSFTGEEEAWWLWFGITAVMADKLMDSRPSWLFTWLPSSHCFPAFIWKGQGTTHCPAEKDIQINGKGINHFLREQSKKYWSVLFNFSERSSTIMHLLTCFQSLHRQEVGGRPGADSVPQPSEGPGLPTRRPRTSNAQKSEAKLSVV